MDGIDGRQDVIRLERVAPTPSKGKPGGIDVGVRWVAAASRLERDDSGVLVKVRVHEAHDDLAGVAPDLDCEALAARAWVVESTSEQGVVDGIMFTCGEREQGDFDTLTICQSDG